MIVVSKEIGEQWAETNVCSECGGRLTLAWGGSYGEKSHVLICANSKAHKGIARPFHLAPADNPAFNLYDVNKDRRKELTEKIGEEKTKALEQYEQKTNLGEIQARTIIQSIWPDAPIHAVLRGALICHQYGLNPLMKHLALVKFHSRTTNRDTWEPIIAIKGSRIIAAPQGCWSYLDDSPRAMMEIEGLKILGEDEYDPTNNYYSICKLKDMATGREASGIGVVGKDESIYGTDKGNTPRNQCNIRSERQALDRLYPDSQPKDVDVTDENYLGEPAGVCAKTLDTPDKKTIDTVQGEVVNTPEPSEPVPTPQADTSKYGHIDASFVDDALSRLKRGWPQTEIYKHLKEKYLVTGSKLTDAIAKLTNNQAAEFTKELQSRLDLL